MRFYKSEKTCIQAFNRRISILSDLLPCDRLVISMYFEPEKQKYFYFIDVVEVFAESYNNQYAADSSKRSIEDFSNVLAGNAGVKFVTAYSVIADFSNGSK